MKKRTEEHKKQQRTRRPGGTRPAVRRVENSGGEATSTTEA
jgi:hypothetical protein